MQITDEMVGAAARAILAAELWPGSWEKANETERGHVLYKARAALTAVLPMIRGAVVEEAARIAEGWPINAAGDDYQTNGNGCFWDAGTIYHQGRMDAAAAIRAMKGGEG